MKRLILSFLKFAGLSGIGWLLDASMLIVIIYFTILPPLPGNIVSSCTASLTVFLLSRELVFYKASGAGLRRLFWYLLYTLTVILAASMLLGALVAVLQPQTEAFGGPWAATIAVAIAKVLVTPPQLIMNFIASRFLSERRFAGPV